MKDKWVCEIHNQEEWTCIKERGYYFHMKNFDWGKLPKFLKEESPEPPIPNENPPTNQ